MTSFKPGSTLGNRTGALNRAPAGGSVLSSNLPEEKPALFGSVLVALYIFLITGRILDISPIWFLHIPLILLVVLTVMMLSRGGFGHSFGSKLTKYFTAFTIWVALCFPFSSWRFASLPSVQLQAQCLLIFLVVVQVVRTRQDWERVAGAYAYAILGAALLTFVIGINVQGRIALPNGTLGDPNEFALHMVLGLPFWWFKASKAKGFRKILFYLYTLPIYLAFARAGSRAGLLALGVLLVITFVFAEGGKKVLLAVVMVGGVAASSVVLPGYLKTRFTTFFSPAEGDFDSATKARIDSDIASSNERKALLQQSLSMTFRHPIVGVGPGTFSFVSRDERIANGERGGENLVTHNTYTQISSECGLPGFFFFAATVVMAVAYTFTDYRRLQKFDRELAQYARYAFTALLGMAIGIFFLSVGYTHLLGTMFALALSLHKVAQAAAAKAEFHPAIGLAKPLSSVPLRQNERRTTDRQFPPQYDGRAPSRAKTFPSSNR